MANSTAVVNQLRALHTLTRVEIAVTRARAGQASTPAVRQELLANAAAAAARAERIAQVLDGLGAGPDPITAAVGWASTAVRTALEQVQPLDQALLGDLALQHQLAERGRYLLTCAGDAPPAVRELAAQLVDDHLETIDRLRDLLAELASGGDSELRPTPLQALTVGFVRVASLPARLTLAGLQRAVGARHGRATDEPPTGAPPRPSGVGVEPADVDPASAAARDAAADIQADDIGGVAFAPSDIQLADVETTLADLEPADVDTADLDTADLDADLGAADLDTADLAPDDVEPLDVAAGTAAVDAIDAEAGDIKTTISDPDAEVDPAAEAALTIIGPGSDVHDDLEAAPAATEPPIGSAADSEIATEAARWDDADDAPPTTPAGDDAELPIPGYDSLPVRGIVVALRGINDDADLTAVEQYERSHKNRTDVLTAVQNRTEALAHDTARGLGPYPADTA